jgi:glycerol-3-phosphate O-acyltransferase
VVSIVLQVLGAVAAYELLRFVLFRRVRRAVRAGAVRFVREHRIRLESARFIDRVWVREALAQDPFIETKIAEVAHATGEPPSMLRERVDEYVDEIAPFFSLSAYYRLGAVVGKRIVDFCFEVVLEPGGFERQLQGVPADAVRVYVINHRANMDPLILSYGLLRHVPMSYAVGEWALVWPLHTLFRWFGSYFVRRGEKDPLYHAVLERFVQLIAGEGAVTGFFLEGGLSRDGRLRRPRTGLLDYIVKLRRDHPNREIVFMPVGLNYDRVFEDRILTRELSGPLPKPTRVERLYNVLGLLFWIPRLVVAKALRVATRSHKKFGYAAVFFGSPVILSEFPGGAGAHEQDDEARLVVIEALAERLMVEGIGRVVPATPVPLFCAAQLQDGDQDAPAVTRRIVQIMAAVRAAGAPVALGRAFDAFEGRRDELGEAGRLEEAEQVYILASLALVRRAVVRRVVTPTGPGVEVVDGSEAVVRYYANSIAHHLG